MNLTENMHEKAKDGQPAGSEKNQDQLEWRLKIIRPKENESSGKLKLCQLKSLL